MSNDLMHVIRNALGLRTGWIGVEYRNRSAGKQRRTGRHICLDIVLPIQVVENTYELVMHQVCTIELAPVISGAPGPFKEFFYISGQPRAKTAMKTEGRDFRIFGEQVSQVIEQAVMIQRV